jgi:tetratricopeptide (TPR) repeat protein
MEGDKAGAGTLWQSSLALFRLLEDTAGVARVMVNLGLLHYDLGDDASAVAAWTESLALMRQLDLPKPNVAEALLNLGMVYTRQRRYAEAETCLAEAGAIWRATGDQAGIVNTLVHMGDLARYQEQSERAIQLYTESARISVALGDRYHLPMALEGIAYVLLHGPAADTHQQETCVLSTYLLACAAALRESTGVQVHIAHQDIYYTNLHLLQMLLGAATFEATWTEGWEMSVLDLIEQLPT